MYRWLKDPGFQAEFQASRRLVVEQVTTRLTALASNAAAALERNLSANIPNAEVRAAAIVFENLRNLVVAEDQSTRIAELERQMTEKVCKLEEIIQGRRTRNGAASRN
jgi:hypothetical protein